MKKVIIFICTFSLVIQNIAYAAEGEGTGTYLASCIEALTNQNITASSSPAHALLLENITTEAQMFEFLMNADVLTSPDLFLSLKHVMEYKGYPNEPMSGSGLMRPFQERVAAE